MRIGAVIPRYNLEKLWKGQPKNSQLNSQMEPPIPLVLNDLLEAIQCAIVPIGTDCSVVLQLSAKLTLVENRVII